MANMPPVIYKKDAEKPINRINPPSSVQNLNKVEDFNNIVVMSGTAKRKSLEKKESHLELKFLQKNNLKDSFIKLRAPFYKSHHKQAQTDEKLMTKSCEILLGCIKPYKDIRISKRTKVTESIRIGSILKTTNVIFERKATRKVQFFTFSDKNQTPGIFLNTQSLDSISGTSSTDFDHENLEINDEGEGEVFDQAETYSNQTGRTTSSEDFITKVFSQE